VDRLTRGDTRGRFAEVGSWRIAANLAVIVQLPLVLAVIYGLAVVIWYELLRRVLLKRVFKRRRSRDRRDDRDQLRRQQAALEQSEQEALERRAAEESERDPARRHYYLARRTAEAERDAAVETANAALEQAVDRIERRYREIEAALDREERERIKAQRRPGQAD
jgi:biopolymer transport protein ExbB/TolQ